MRPSRDEYFLAMAKLAASRGTCFRRQVGCILINERGHVLATGYNGVASGVPHCNEWTLTAPDEKVYPFLCPGALATSGTNLDACQAIHAEQNALLQCHDVYEIHTAYCTDSPCITCVKLLMNTSCGRIVFSEKYAHDEPAMKLWVSFHKYRNWIHYGH